MEDSFASGTVLLILLFFFFRFFIKELTKKNNVLQNIVLYIITFLAIAISFLYCTFIPSSIFFIGTIYFAFIIYSSKYRKKEIKINNYNENKETEKLKKYLYNLFVNVMEAFSTNDTNTLKLLCSKEMYNMLLMELKNNDELDTYNYLTNFDLNSFTITNTNEDVIYANLNVSFINYTTSKKGKILSGNKTRKKRNTFKVKFKNISSNKFICISCGAPIKDEVDTCPYCNNKLDYIKSRYQIESIE